MSLRDLLHDDTTFARHAPVMLGSAPRISFDFVISSQFACLLATDGFVVTMDLLLRNFYVAVGVRYLYSMLPGVFGAVHETKRLRQRLATALAAAYAAAIAKVFAAAFATALRLQ